MKIHKRMHFQMRTQQFLFWKMLFPRNLPFCPTTTNHHKTSFMVPTYHNPAILPSSTSSKPAAKIGYRGFLRRFLNYFARRGSSTSFRLHNHKSWHDVVYVGIVFMSWLVFLLSGCFSTRAFLNVESSSPLIGSTDDYYYSACGAASQTSCSFSPFSPAIHWLRTPFCGLCAVLCPVLSGREEKGGEHRQASDFSGGWEQVESASRRLATLSVIEHKVVLTTPQDFKEFMEAIRELRNYSESNTLVNALLREVDSSDGDQLTEDLVTKFFELMQWNFSKFNMMWEWLCMQQYRKKVGEPHFPNLLDTDTPIRSFDGFVNLVRGMDEKWKDMSFAQIWNGLKDEYVKQLPAVPSKDAEEFVSHLWDFIKKHPDKQSVLWDLICWNTIRDKDQRSSTPTESLYTRRKNTVMLPHKDIFHNVVARLEQLKRPDPPQSLPLTTSPYHKSSAPACERPCTYPSPSTSSLPSPATCLYPSPTSSICCTPSTPTLHPPSHPLIPPVGFRSASTPSGTTLDTGKTPPDFPHTSDSSKAAPSDKTPVGFSNTVNPTFDSNHFSDRRPPIPGSVKPDSKNPSIDSPQPPVSDKTDQPFPSHQPHDSSMTPGSGKTPVGSSNPVNSSTFDSSNPSINCHPLTPDAMKPSDSINSSNPSNYDRSPSHSGNRSPDCHSPQPDDSSQPPGSDKTPVDLSNPANSASRSKAPRLNSGKVSLELCVEQLEECRDKSTRKNKLIWLQKQKIQNISSVLSYEQSGERTKYKAEYVIFVIKIPNDVFEGMLWKPEQRLSLEAKIMESMRKVLAKSSSAKRRLSRSVGSGPNDEGEPGEISGEQEELQVVSVDESWLRSGPGHDHMNCEKDDHRNGNKSNIHPTSQMVTNGSSSCDRSNGTGCSNDANSSRWSRDRDSSVGCQHAIPRGGENTATRSRRTSASGGKQQWDGDDYYGYGDMVQYLASKAFEWFRSTVLFYLDDSVATYPRVPTIDHPSHERQLLLEVADGPKAVLRGFCLVTGNGGIESYGDFGAGTQEEQVSKMFRSLKSGEVGVHVEVTGMRKPQLTKLRNDATGAPAFTVEAAINAIKSDPESALGLSGNTRVELSDSVISDNRIDADIRYKAEQFQDSYDPNVNILIFVSDYSKFGGLSDTEVSDVITKLIMSDYVSQEDDPILSDGLGGGGGLIFDVERVVIRGRCIKVVQEDASQQKNSLSEAGDSRNNVVRTSDFGIGMSSKPRVAAEVTLTKEGGLIHALLLGKQGGVYDKANAMSVDEAFRRMRRRIQESPSRVLGCAANLLYAETNHEYEDYALKDIERTSTFSRYAVWVITLCVLLPIVFVAIVLGFIWKHKSCPCPAFGITRYGYCTDQPETSAENAQKNAEQQSQGENFAKRSWYKITRTLDALVMKYAV